MVVKQQCRLARFNVYFAALIACTSATATASVLTWISPTLPLITKLGSKIFVNIEQGAWLGSLPSLGACFGPFITGQIVDRFGRKCIIVWVLVVLTLSWVVMYFSTALAVLYCARFVAGLAVGCIYGTVPMYVAEMAPCELRGMLSSFLLLFNVLGCLIEYTVGAFVSYETLIAVTAAIPMFCIFAILWIPESPYYLRNKGRETEALEALQFFRGYADVSTLQREIADMEASARNMEINKGSFKTLFAGKENLKCLYYSATLTFFQQATGISVIIFYSKSIFEDSGSFLNANWCSIIVALVMTFTLILTFVTAKIFKAKHLLAFSALGGIFSMASLGTYYYLKAKSDVTSLNWLPLTSLILFVFTYTAGGVSPLVWAIVSEIYPSHLKALGCGLCASLGALLCFLLTRFFIPIIETYGKDVGFWGFGIVSVFEFFFVVFQLPDTHGMTFQEIQQLIQGKKDTENITQK